MSDLEQEFYNTLTTYDFFARSGRMDIEEHCLWATIALNLDGVRPVPSVDAFFQLLTSMAREASRLHGTPQLESSRFEDGVAYEEQVHPGGRVTLLHIATAIHIFDRYIFRVGALLGKRPSHATPQSGFWIEPEWVCTAAFFDAFQRSVSALMVKADEKVRQESGYSMLEVMHLSGEGETDRVLSLLASHAERTSAELELIVAAIDGHAYDEAINIEHRLLESTLAATLRTHGSPHRGRLVDLIATAQKLDIERSWGTPDSFWRRLDDWRKLRNGIVHSPVTSLLVAPSDPADLRASYREAALSGVELVREVRSWGINARAMAMDMSLPRPSKRHTEH